MNRWLKHITLTDFLFQIDTNKRGRILEEEITNHLEIGIPPGVINLFIYLMPGGYIPTPIIQRECYKFKRLLVGSQSKKKKIKVEIQPSIVLNL